MDVNFYILAIFLIIAFYLDVRYSKIPNWLTMGGVLIGLLYHLIDKGTQGLLFSFLGLAIAGGILLLLYVFKGVGAGDVKLFAAIGALTGTQFALYGLMYSIVLAGFIGVILLLLRRDFMKRIVYTFYRIIVTIFKRESKTLEEFKRKEAVRFPFMYAVLPGMIITAYYFF